MRVIGSKSNDNFKCETYCFKDLGFGVKKKVYKMIGRCLCGVKNLPDFFAGILFISVITSFVIAVAQSDVSPLFPAISDTATKSPESNIFSQLVNISTFIGLILMYIRYLQVNRDIERFEGAGVTRYLNRYILPIGLIAILGCSIVANFPVSIYINMLVVVCEIRSSAQ